VSIRLLIFRIYSTQVSNCNVTTYFFRQRNPLFSCALHVLVSYDHVAILTASCPLAVHYSTLTRSYYEVGNKTRHLLTDNEETVDLSPGTKNVRNGMKV
jgi:hypothetical protein